MEEPSAEPAPGPEPQQVRTVDDVEVLKALADPTRLAILTALMKTSGDLPVMSVKELAAELGEPQTKLYRHVRQLEAAGLIKVAATRLVSGILEQRYQAAQRDLTFARSLLREHAGQADLAMQAVFDRYRDGMLTALREEKLPELDPAARDSYRSSMLFMTDLRIPAAKAAQLRSKLEELIGGLHDEQVQEPGGVPVHLLFGYYITE